MRPRGGARAVHYVMCAVVIATRCSMVAQTASLLRSSAHPLRVLPFLFLLLFDIASNATLFFRLGALTSTQCTDCMLGYIIYNPLAVNVMGFLFLPSYDVTARSWIGFNALHLAFAAIILSLPPAHLCLQWLVYAPVVIFLDYQSALRSSSDGSDMCTADAFAPGVLSFAHYLCTRGVVAVSAGAVGTIVARILLRPAEGERREAAGSGEGGERAATAAAEATAAASLEGSGREGQRDVDGGPDLLPLESLGINVVSCLGLRPLLRALEHGLEAVVSRVSRMALLALVCLPISGWCILTMVMSKFHSEAFDLREVSAEQWLVRLLVFFVLGRESNNIDVEGFVDKVSRSLEASRLLLCDLLPVHVVDALLRTAIQQQQADEQQQGQGKQQGQGQGQGWGLHGRYPSGPSEDAPSRCFSSSVNSPVGSKRYSSPGGGQEHSKAATRYSSRSGGLLTAQRLASGRDGASAEGGGAGNAVVVSAPALALSMSGEHLASGEWHDLDEARRFEGRHIRTLVPPLSPCKEADVERTSFPSPRSPPPAADGAAERDSADGSAEAATPDAPQQGTEQQPGPPRPAASNSWRLLQLFTDGLPSSWRPCTPTSEPAEAAFGRVSGGSSSHGGNAAANALQHPALQLPPSLTVAASHECITVIMCDIVGFSTWAHHLSPDKVMGTLNDLYTRLDDILIHEMPSLYKVEMIGDAYIVAANLLSADPEHAATAVRFALRAQEEAAKVLRPDLEDGSVLQMRAGLHSGPAMSGCLGKVRRRFTIFGNTVNMASRTETTCPPGCIQLTARTHALASPHLLAGEVQLQERGPVWVKGADQPITMFLAARPDLDALFEDVLSERGAAGRQGLSGCTGRAVERRISSVSAHNLVLAGGGLPPPQLSLRRRSQDCRSAEANVARPRVLSARGAGVESGRSLF